MEEKHTLVPFPNINYNPNMDGYAITSIMKSGMKLLIHSKLQQYNRWSLGMDK